MTEPIFISIIYFCFFTIYITFSFYIATLNKPLPINRVFLYILVCLSIWSFSFSISTSAADYETALLWRKIATFGWGIVYSLILHFVLLLIDNDDNDIFSIKLNKWWYPFIYTPVVINLLLFTFIKDVANQQFDLIHTSFGWTNQMVYTLPSTYFNIYYLVTILLIFIFFILWGVKSKSTERKKIFIMLLISFGLAFAIGTVIDLFTSLLFSTPIIQIGPIVAIFPVFTIFFATKKYNFTRKKEVFEQPDSNELLTQESRNGILIYLSFLMLLGALLSFIYDYFFYGSQLLNSAVFSLIMVVMASILYLLPNIKTSQHKKDFILIFNLAIFVPYVLIKYALIDAAVTIWTLPLFIILLSVLLSNNLGIYIASGVSLLTLSYIWIKQPITYKIVNWEEHLLRIIIVLTFTWFTAYIRRLYLKRLKQSESQIKYQQLLAMVSAEVLTVNKDNIREKFSDTLELIGAYTGFERLYILRLTNNNILDYELEYYDNTVASPSNYDNVTDFNWLIDVISQEGHLIIENTSKIPSYAKAEKEFFINQKTNSSVILPISIGSAIVGYIGFETISNRKRPSDDELNQYQVLTNILSDAFQKTLSEIEIHNLAYYDTLTGLPNRALLRRELDRELNLAKLRLTQFSVLFIDLDAFKFVNDSIGHTGGDLLLRLVTKRISKCLGTKDTLFRFSGDEFIIIQPTIEDYEDSVILAESIINALRKRFRIEHNDFIVTSSVGIALYPQDGTTADALIKNADFSMYQAKIAGKNQYMLCTKEVKDNIEYRNKLILLLQKAIENNEFTVYYQPQVNILSGEISGYEALLRWTTPELGSIPPSVFIPLAEQCGLIKPIGEWVFTSVCRQYEVWEGLKVARVPVAVNLSSQQFKAVELIKFIKKTLKDTNMNPELLEIEITESVAIKDTDETIDILNKIKELGITVAIDDFGTEYSSLSRLKELPIDRVKIAMNFIHGINIDPKDEAIINVIIYLSEKLGLRVIAEGVENMEQMEYLKRERCEDIQGYYYYKPIPAEELEKLFEEGDSKFSSASPS